MSDTEKTPSAAPSSEDIDRLSLAQALQDFEVANARVMDLTQRLTSHHRELVEATNELEKLKLRNQSLRSRNRRLKAELETLQSSRAFKSAATASRMVGKARRRLGK